MRSLVELLAACVLFFHLAQGAVVLSEMKAQTAPQVVVIGKEKARVLLTQISCLAHPSQHLCQRIRLTKQAAKARRNRPARR